MEKMLTKEPLIDEQLLKQITMVIPIDNKVAFARLC